MTNPQYNLKPLQNAQSIPIVWEFSQADYDKLAIGHRSNWCVFLRDDVVHVCRVSGEEFYRFRLRKLDEDTYLADSLETYTADNFSVAAEQHGWTKMEIEQHQADFSKLAVEETAGLVDAYFGTMLSERSL